MVISVSRSRLREENAGAFQALADEMMELARAMPGFRSYETYSLHVGEPLRESHFERPQSGTAGR